MDENSLNSGLNPDLLRQAGIPTQEAPVAPVDYAAQLPVQPAVPDINTMQAAPEAPIVQPTLPEQPAMPSAPVVSETFNMPTSPAETPAPSSAPQDATAPVPSADIEAQLAALSTPTETQTVAPSREQTVQPSTEAMPQSESRIPTLEEVDALLENNKKELADLDDARAKLQDDAEKLTKLREAIDAVQKLQLQLKDHQTAVAVEPVATPALQIEPAFPQPSVQGVEAPTVAPVVPVPQTPVQDLQQAA